MFYYFRFLSQTSIETLANGAVRPAIFHDPESPSASNWPVPTSQITLDEAKRGTEGRYKYPLFEFLQTF